MIYFKKEFEKNIKNYMRVYFLPPKNWCRLIVHLFLQIRFLLYRLSKTAYCSWIRLITFLSIQHEGRKDCDESQGQII